MHKVIETLFQMPTTPSCFLPVIMKTKKTYYYRYFTIFSFFISLNLLISISEVQAQDWPNVIWTPYQNDDPSDERPRAIDLWGDDTFPGAWYAYDGEYIYFRERVDGDPGGPRGFAQYAWNVLINTDGNPQDYEWIIALDGINEEVTFIENVNKELDSWNDPAEGTDGKGAPNASYSAATNARFVLADSNFGGDPDYFVDWGIPYSDFAELLGTTETSEIQFLFTTSANANNYNKDKMGGDPTTFSEAWGAPTNLLGTPTLPGNPALSKTILSGPTNPRVRVSDTWQIQIQISNTGDRNLADVVITDMLNLDVVESVTIDSFSSGSAVWDGNKTVAWTMDDVNDGMTETLIYSVTGYFTDTGGGSRTLNTVVADAKDPATGEPVTSGEVSDPGFEVFSPILAISKSVDKGSATPNQIITYTIAYQNTGTAESTNTILTDEIPTNTTYVADSATGGGTYDGGTNTLTWDLGVLIVGTTDSVSFQVTINSDAPVDFSIDNTAILASIEIPDGVSATVSTAVTGTTGTITSTTPIVPGDVVIIIVTDADLNTDPGIAETFQLVTTNTVTGETELLTYTETGPDTGVFAATVNTTYGTTAGTNDDGEFNVQRGDTLVTEYNDAFTETGDTATVTAATIVVQPLFTVTKTVDKTSAEPGEILTYTLTYENIGDGNAREVYFVDLIPENTTYVIGSAAGDSTIITFQHVDGGPFDSSEEEPVTAVMWQLTEPLPSGGSGTLTLQVKIN